MCLAVPVKVLAVNGQQAVIDADGVQREVNIALIKDVHIGDHIVIHAGFAIQKWDQADVDEYQQLMQEMNEQ